MLAKGLECTLSVPRLIPCGGPYLRIPIIRNSPSCLYSG
nr:unnamed protein product [Callosobruchus chinensis]